MVMSSLPPTGLQRSLFGGFVRFSKRNRPSLSFRKMSVLILYGRSGFIYRLMVCFSKLLSRYQKNLFE